MPGLGERFQVRNCLPSTAAEGASKIAGQGQAPPRPGGLTEADGFDRAHE